MRAPKWFVSFSAPLVYVIVLLDAAVLDGDLAEQRRRQPLDNSQEAKSGFTAISRSMAWTLRCAKVTLGM
jgi:hypothetical protein